MVKNYVIKWKKGDEEIDVELKFSLLAIERFTKALGYEFHEIGKALGSFNMSKIRTLFEESHKVATKDKPIANVYDFDDILCELKTDEIIKIIGICLDSVREITDNLAVQVKESEPEKK